MKPNNITIYINLNENLTEKEKECERLLSKKEQEENLTGEQVIDFIIDTLYN